MKNMNGNSLPSRLFAAAIMLGLAACNANQSKPEAETAPLKAASKAPEPVVESKPVPESKPVCKVESKSKTKSGKTKSKAAAPPDCVPASATAATPVVPSASAAGHYDLSKNKPVTDSTKVEAGQGTQVKGLNDWQGEISGLPAANSRFTRLKIGMSQQQVTDIVGQPTDQGAYVTGKAFIPFYFGSDKTRWEMAYKGQGRLIFSNQAGFGSGHYLTWIIHNANEGGYR